MMSAVDIDSLLEFLESAYRLALNMTVVKNVKRGSVNSWRRSLEIHYNYLKMFKVCKNWSG